MTTYDWRRVHKRRLRVPRGQETSTYEYIEVQTRNSKELHGSPCDGSVKSAGPLC